PAPQQAAPPRPPQHQQRPQAQGRKKKKFFQKGGGGAPQLQPGNSVNAPPQKRKNKQRGPREFVGPMDHSYRAVNGNVADGPASTIQITNNGHGSYYPDIYAAPAPAVPVR